MPADGGPNGGATESPNGGPDDDPRTLLAGIPLFAGLGPEEVDGLLARCPTRQVAASEWCVHEGDPADALFVVLGGRLQAFVGGRATPREMSRGQVFGEIGVLTGERRTAGVRALRDSELLVVPTGELDRLAGDDPGWLRQVARIVVDRLVAGPDPSAGERVLAVSFFGVSGPGPVASLAAGVRDVLGARSPTVLAGAADVPPPGERVRWGHRLERSYRYVLYDAGAGPDAWQRWCATQSDRVVVVADAGDRRPTLPAALAGELEERARSGTVTLVLVHPAHRTLPGPVDAWRSLVGDVPVLHLREGRRSDVARVARLLTGQGLGLVLGGGGPRGFAHLGVMQALDEAGVEVDAVGGTSIGAIMAGLRAMDLDHETRRERATTALVRSGNLFSPTLPVLSFSSARRVRRLLEDPRYFGDVAIEQCWLPYFCVSANLTRAETVVHDRGPMATAVRASLSLPGVFPPVRMGTDFLVDGGVLNNLPVDVMRRRLGRGPVVAVDLSVPVEYGAPEGYEETPSGWRLLVERFRRRARPSPLPLAMGVLMRAKDLASIQVQRELVADHQPDLLVRPDVSGFGMFDFKAAEVLIDVGYREAVARIAQWGRDR